MGLSVEKGLKDPYQLPGVVGQGLVGQGLVGQGLVGQGLVGQDLVGQGLVGPAAQSNVVAVESSAYF